MADTGGNIVTPALVKTVSAGTRVQCPALKAGSEKNQGTGKSILVQALSTNTEPVVIGDKTVVAAAGTQAAPTQVGIELKPSQAISLDLLDTAQIWLDTRTSKDGIVLLVLTA